MNKIFLLSAVLTLMSWQGLLASPDFSDERTAPLGPRMVFKITLPQGPLIGNVPSDVMGRIFANLSFTEGWKFLGVNKFHHEHAEVWKGFSSLHGYDSLIKGGDTAEKIRWKIIEETRSALRSVIPPGEAVVPLTWMEEHYPTTSDKSFPAGVMASLLQSAQEKPFLWDTLIDALWEKMHSMYPQLSIKRGQEETSSDAYCGIGFFKDVSEDDRRAFLVRVAGRRNLDGSPGLDAKNAQEILNDAASDGKLGFTPDRGTLTSGYDYLVGVSKRRNPDGTPGFGAEDAQLSLNSCAVLQRGIFKGISRENCRTYIEEIAGRRNPDGTPGLGAKNAQELKRGGIVLDTPWDD